MLKATHYIRRFRCDENKYSYVLKFVVETYLKGNIRRCLTSFLKNQNQLLT